MRVNDDKARWFYEHEAITCSWNKRELERNINSYYYERLLKSNYPQQMLESARNENVTVDPASESLKDPYVLEFLELPDIYNIHESQLESAIITNLQQFLLELGKGFAFVARQKRLQYDDDFFYIDLVFYNYILKFFLLIDLKIDELTHKDVRQMDSYVRMFDDISTSKDDNPTIGLILCTKKNKTVAKYSVLSERKQIFASKYMLYLPTEQELVNELEHKRLLIEDRLSMENHEDD